MTRNLTRNYSLSVRAKGRLNIRDVAPKFSSMKLAAAAIRGALTLAVLSALLLIAARPAQAQTETVLYNFAYNSGDSYYPDSRLTPDAAGNFYGGTMGGGAFGYGAVFELSPNGNGGWNGTTLYSFNFSDGAYPWFAYVIFDSVGNLYGTTWQGGANNAGVVFELSPANGTWTETVLHDFAGGTADGGCPENGLIMDPAGNLYGQTVGCTTPGTVFELSPSPGGWTFQTIYNEQQGGGYGGLTMDASGNIFGDNSYTVFELSPNGNRGWTPTVIHTFAGAPKDGSAAQCTPVLDQHGNLYVTTSQGGASNYGTVYKLSPGENGEWTGQILYSFKGVKDGANPFAGIVFDAAGNIYGTTVAGGGETKGPGTVFELLAPVGTGTYQEKILWSFNGADGASPYGSLILDKAGNLYGTTIYGGASGVGVVFEVSGVPKATTTTLTSAPNPSTYGQPMTFAAVVTSSVGAPPDGETVTFKEGTTVLGTGALSGGSASYTTSALPVGTIAVRAVYGGDLHLFGSTSNTLKQVVKKAATTTTLESSPNPSTYGQAVIFTAVVTSSVGAPPDGDTVTFKGGTAVLGTGALSGGSASLTTSALPGGTNWILAVYGGDIHFAGGVSNVVKQVVKKVATTTTLKSSPNPSTYGQAVIFTAVVTSSVGAPPDGDTVTFKGGTAVLGTGALSGGSASFTTSALPVGTDYIKAVYGGDSKLAGGVSNVVKQVVN